MTEPSKGPNPKSTGPVNSPQADTISLYSVQGDKDKKTVAPNGETESLGSARSSLTGTAIGDGTPKSKSKYAGSRWKQEKAAAWRSRIHLLTLPWYLIPIGIFLQGTGLTLYLSLDPANRVIIPYTDCYSIEHPEVRCSKIVTEKDIEATCTCELSHFIAANFKGRVYMDFQLTNFHQNQREYIVSVDEDQMQGKLFKKDCNHIFDIKKSRCRPPRFKKNRKTNKSIYPCGRFANSMFSDDVIMSSSDPQIEWLPITATLPESIKDIEYRNPFEKFDKKSPKCSKTDLKKMFSKPEHWSTQFWDNFIENKGARWERFISWMMRPQAFSTFTVPYRYFDGDVKSCQPGVKGICKGWYKFVIQYRYPTVSYGGTKSLVLSDKRFITDDSNFLFIACLTVGTVCTCIGLVALIFLLMEREAKKTGKRNQVIRLSNSSITPDPQLIPLTQELSPNEIQT